MKQTLKTIIRSLRSAKVTRRPNLLRQLLDGYLGCWQPPKLSEMSEGTKAEKSRNEIDKMIKQAGQFYQDIDEEGRGRFPGQAKFNVR